MNARMILFLSERAKRPYPPITDHDLRRLSSHSVISYEPAAAVVVTMTFFFTRARHG